MSTSDIQVFSPVLHLAVTASLEFAVSEIRDVIVEARFDQAHQIWRLVRLRMDKPRPNHLEVVQTIMQNVVDPISLRMVGNSAHTGVTQRS
jgi:hypothetical protein